ncbi:hypothetical protein [Methylocaldum sp.]|uniref:hypothetical protein n=1 Tax=Methylocaldum sp. TaxID=1969727 RepID=UPI002D72DF85|nr:hypothetical protein [Methylocaldum sp.]HYE35908.1 hypothetical protein [Methylocaldum sp.]
MLIIISCAAIIATRWLSDSKTVPAGHRLRPTAEIPTALEERWGIRLLGIRLSAAGNMLDFRYRIVDAEKAAPLADRKVQPYVMDQTSGSRLLVPTTPTVGSLRQTSIKPLVNRTYFALFANPGRQIDAGDKVTVVMGDFRAENLIVE